ncbi:nucleoporin-62 C-terminal-like protein isoform X2 [Bufo gargarizans]|uniref:nucleoporin-62 C-terminal-like protein isoform X2 n=1 Tax=Bufo gargarizans TaxID=30331 RepID=UPI001CF1358F|nr:nucleoporin-62 C-terminal-like protein isoform X2 [Bufo gargarizans]
MTCTQIGIKMSGFNFGTSSSSGGFSFGTPKTTTSTGATSFSIGGAPAPAPSAGFSFATMAQTPAATAAQSNQTGALFSFSTPPASAAPTSGFSFGAQPASTTSTGGLVLGNAVPKLGLGGVTQPSSGSSISGTPQNSGFAFGGTTVTQPLSAPSTIGGGFTFAGAVTTTMPSTIATVTATTQATSNAVQTPAFSMVTPLTSNIATAATASAQPALVQSSNLFGKPPESTQGSTTSSTTSTLGLCSSLATSAAPLFSITPTSSASAALTSKPQMQTPGAVHSITSGSTPVSTPAVMTYAQLENLINKWSLELEDQEKHFLQQATQVNAWDRTLITNGERITSLHREMEKVKLDQKRLDQELDFILSQQKELEDLLTPLEDSVKEQSGTIYLQHADEEREKTYKLAENIDAQLKRMAQDLKDVIEHLNTTAGPGDASNPLQQICKILNAHVDSLQWIDQNSALLQRKVEQVAKECESRRKEQERGYSITFD